MENEKVVIGYMCGVDWDHELGNALGGNTIYPSESDLMANKRCTDECGIVEVEVRLKKRIKECDFSIKPEKTYRVSYRKNGIKCVKEATGQEILDKALFSKDISDGE